MSHIDDKEFENFLYEQGYQQVRKLADGEWIFIVRLFSTHAVCCGADYTTSFKYRWCFKNPAEALSFFETCENYDDIPVLRESLVGHRYQKNPLLVEYDDYGIPKW